MATKKKINSILYISRLLLKLTRDVKGRNQGFCIYVTNRIKLQKVWDPCLMGPETKRQKT